MTTANDRSDAARPAADTTPRAWRSLDEKRGTAPAADPGRPIQIGTKTVARDGNVGRRDFFAIGGATAAMVGAAGCLRRPLEHILPYTEGPEYTQPGIELHYATSVQHGGEAVGLLVESHEGRPTKIEGNTQHPASRGATDASLQASILDLYDDARSRAPLRRSGDGTEEGSWSDFDAWWRSRADDLAADGGAGLRVLMEPSLSPSMDRARAALLERFPNAHVHTWTADGRREVQAGTDAVFGEGYEVWVDYARPRVILALDSDFLGRETGHIEASRRFAARRRPQSADEADRMNRLYVVEGTVTLTGMTADHRLRLRSTDVEAYLKALLVALSAFPDVQMPAEVRATLGDGSAPEGVPEAWVSAVAEDLRANRSQSAVVVGSRQPARVHALAHIANLALGNFRRTVFASPRPETPPTEPLEDLVEAMQGEAVDTLLILGGNPVYDAPADLAFADALSRVPHAVHLSSRVDETSSLCEWHLPQSHPLEAWGDQRSLTGVVSIQQPLIAPLRSSRSDAEVLAMVGGIRGWRGYHLVRNTLRGLMAADAPLTAFERVWRRSLQVGRFFGVRPERPVAPPLQTASFQALLGQSAPTAGDGWEVVFTPSYQVGDGRQANNPWLLELPEPVTKQVWGNAAWISPAAARELGVASGDLLTLSREGADDLRIPAFVLPGHADRVVTLPLGFGRTAAGRHGTGVGVDVYPFRTRDALGFAGGVTVRPAGGHEELVQTQTHHSMTPVVTVLGNEVEFPERPLAVSATVEQYRERPDFAQWREPTPSVGPLWDEVDYRQPRMPAQGTQTGRLIPNGNQPSESAPIRHAWGMTIDLSACTGCSACVVACQAENNVATVGPAQVALGREMHWIRIDRYYRGDEANPEVVVQPVACQHCEEAPCENVCPVAATVHDQEGINAMAYNRCIGTRYCMNNCPYKVRRFNFLDYHRYHNVPDLKRMVFNPNVTVRMRGVMEKCTYCVQRIQSSRIAANRVTSRRLQRRFEEGETAPDWAAVEERLTTADVVPACAQACPSDAIVFGDLNDDESRVSELARMDRHYKLLAAVGTQPRTTYLAKVRNVNPALAAGGEAHAENG
ncbi:MAG: 4Fe-4S dicluster domain-containing protein [Sandaracinaceae bacterium]